MPQKGRLWFATRGGKIGPTYESSMPGQHFYVFNNFFSRTFMKTDPSGLNLLNKICLDIRLHSTVIMTNLVLQLVSQHLPVDIQWVLFPSTH